MHFLNLPTEIIHEICHHAVDSIPQLSQTNQKLRQLCQYNALWKRLCEPLYEEIGMEMEKYSDFYTIYWQLMETSWKVGHMLDKVVHNQGEGSVDICQFGPSARLSLNRTKDSTDKLTHAYYSRAVLDVIAKRETLTKLALISQNSASYDVADVYNAIQYGQQHHRPKVTIPQIKTTHDTQKLALNLLDSVTEAVKDAVKMPRQPGAKFIELMRYRSIVLISEYVNALKSHGINATTLLYLKGKWQAFVKVDEDLYVCVDGAGGVLNQQSVDKRVQKQGLQWAEFSSFSSTIAKEAWYGEACSAVLSDPEFLQWAGPLELANPDCTVTINHHSGRSVKASTVIDKILQQVMPLSTAQSSNNDSIGSVVQDMRLSNGQYGVVTSCKQQQDCSETYLITTSSQEDLQLPKEFAKVVHLSELDVHEHFGVDGMVRLGRHFGSYDQSLHRFVQ